MLKIGDIAPHFTLTSTDGRSISWGQDKKFVLFFFPKAFTSGCTLEVRAFQKVYPLFQSQHIEVIGVSVDSEKTQCEFAEKEQLSFPMVADNSKELSKQYDTLWPIVGKNKRVTYIIQEGKIAACFSHELDATKHIQDALDFFGIKSSSAI